MSAAFIRVWTLLALWTQRIRDRDELRNMAETDRRDLRLSPCDVSREANKWFWQA